MGGQKGGGAFSPIEFEHSDFLYFCTENAFFSYLAPPPRKSVKIVSSPEKTEMTSLIINAL